MPTMVRTHFCLIWFVLTLSFFLSLHPDSNSAVAFTSIATPVVICPGFGNDSIDYSEPLKQPSEFGFISALERRGFSKDLIYTVPVQRSDWLRVAGGLLDPGFYTNQALPTGTGYGWYLKKLKATVDLAYQQSGGKKVLLIGHSAGGWLARAAMGDGTWLLNDEESIAIQTADRVRCLITVGAIHKPPSDVTTCVTRGALAYTDRAFPGAYLQDDGITYVSVGGDAILGNNARPNKNKQIERENQSESEFDPSTDADRVYAIRGEGSSSRVAFTSYEAVCGVGKVTGDGVVPLEWTQLDGSTQIRLEGVIHSINEAGTTLPTDRWYGSDAVIDRWLPQALKEAKIPTKNTMNADNNNGNDFLDALQKWVQSVLKSPISKIE